MAVITYNYGPEDYVESGYSVRGIEVFWATKEIFVARESLPLIQTNPIEIRELSITDFHDSLRALEDDGEGIPYDTTHNYVGQITISGVDIAQVMTIINGYTVTFEDGNWAVNITGGNSNIADVVNVNSVGVRTANSAGLVDLQDILTTLSNIPTEVWRVNLPLPE